ncbi:hypothetical protein ACQKE8_24195 [Sphingobium limneticum]|jgi:hypothetical protein|uniref:hypothetical protein n=1 Tax=Sphingobium limneticum TaxID=1007511 RepID=UPI000E766617
MILLSVQSVDSDEWAFTGAWMGDGLSTPDYFAIAKWPEIRGLACEGVGILDGCNRKFKNVIDRIIRST